VYESLRLSVDQTTAGLDAQLIQRGAEGYGFVFQYGGYLFLSRISGGADKYIFGRWYWANFSGLNQQQLDATRKALMAQVGALGFGPCFVYKTYLRCAKKQ
jgi:hypothetical protein